MNIQAVNFSTNKPSFKMLCVNGYYPIGKGQYLGEYKDEIVNSHETYIFRNDINWLAFRDYINERFSDCPKIDTIIYGCSNGSEPYSLSMLMQAMVNNPDRFFPIKAFDIDESLIMENISKKDSFRIENNDFAKIQNLYEIAKKDYTPYVFEDNFHRCYFTNKTTKPVEFKEGNLIEDINRMKFERPTLFIARNMWPYVSPGEYNSFARKLFDKLPVGSSVIIGDFDFRGNRYLGTNDFPNVLLKTGFKQSNLNITRDIPAKNLVFEKN